MIDPEFGEATEAPYLAEYEQVRTFIGDIHENARAGTYGYVESGVIKQIYAPNDAYVPGTEFFNRIGGIFSRRQMPDELEVFELGVDIGAHILENKRTPRAMILGYLNACVWAGSAIAAFVGEGPHVKIEQNILTYTRRQIFDAIPLDARSDNLFRVVAESLSIARERELTYQDTFTWLGKKLAAQYTEFLQAKGLRDHVSDYYADAMELTPSDWEQVDRAARLLNIKSMEKRIYGTKPAYTEASIGGSWIFYDGEEYRSTILRGAKNVVMPHFAAVVHHSPLTNLGNIKMGVEAERMGEMGEMRYLSGGLVEAKQDFHVVIGHDGAICFDYEGLIPLEHILADKPDAARLLKAEIAANFYDLSMPIDDYSVPEPRNYSGMTMLERKNFNPVLQLLVPRIRRMYEPRPPSTESVRTVREHDVTWYKRPLRPGWHASPEALENARRVGVTLEPNETFVRAHKRGEGHEVAGYHAVKRAMDAERGVDY